MAASAFACRRLLAVALGVSALLTGASSFAVARASAAGPLDDAHRATVIARVGPAVITAGDFEDRFAPMPSFQRASWGPTADARRHRFLAEVLVPQILLALAAEARDAGAAPPTSYALERARSGATVRAIRARIGSADAVSGDDVRAYYEQNRERFDAPERYQIWRILCKTEGEARAVLDASKNDPTPKTFSDLARAHSQDKGTYLRGGNLGFVTAAGTSVEPGLRVDPAVVRAAQAVRDGELAPAPVPEGDYFAVVWRRGTAHSIHRSLDEAAAAIRDTLWKERIKTETDRLVASLRAAKVRDVNESLLQSADVPALP